MNQFASNKMHGSILIYTIISMVAMVAFVSLGVDFGRVELTKAELQHAADAAARYGASGLPNIINGKTAAFANAVAAAGENNADGTPVVLDPNTDIELIIWNAGTQTYTVTNDPTLANGIHVMPQRSAARGNAVPLAFAKLLGFSGISTCDVKSASSIAVLIPGTTATQVVKATGNPFLAGMPAGSQASLGNPHNNPDTAGDATTPMQSPMQASIPITQGQALSLDGVVGGANNSNVASLFTADGNTGSIESNTAGNDSNIGNINAPLNSLVGVFLDDALPTSTSTPNPSLVDYSTTSSRNFQSLAPQLKQIFFIGDGRTDDGQVQTFVPPAGATRLFLATWDGYEWNNNVGSFSVSTHLPGYISLVK